MDPSRVSLKGNNPGTCKLVDFFLIDLIRLRRVELELVDLLSIALGFGVEDFLVVAAHEMATDHGLGSAHHFELVFVQRGLHDAIVELHDKHVLLNSSQFLAD